MKNPTKLLPCPFCGHAGMFVMGTHMRSHRIQCTNCGGQTRGTQLKDQVKAKTLAVKYWNQRKAPYEKLSTYPHRQEMPTLLRREASGGNTPQ